MIYFTKKVHKWLISNSTSVVIRKMQMKTTMRFYFTPIRLAKIKKTSTI